MAVRTSCIYSLSVVSTFVPQGIIATMVQLFFAWRLKVLTKNWLVVGIVVLSSSVFGRKSSILPKANTDANLAKCVPLVPPLVSP
jgi:hypothetical protein